MLPDRVSNPEPRTYESGALMIALRGPARRNLSSPQYLLLTFQRRYFCYGSSMLQVVMSVCMVT